MPYRIIINGHVIIKYKILDYFQEPSWETIDCSTVEGKRRYRELYGCYPSNKKNRKIKRGLYPGEHSLIVFFVQNNTDKRDTNNSSTSNPEQPDDIETTEIESTASTAGAGCIPEDVAGRFHETASTRGRPPVPRREEIAERIKEIKAIHQASGRTRIKQELGNLAKCSESTISRILKEQRLQNPRKSKTTEVRIDCWCPGLAGSSENFILECGSKNGLLLIAVLFQQIFEPLIKSFLTREELTTVLAYSFGMLFDKPVYQCLETIPARVMDILGIKRTLTPVKIASTLKMLGYHKSFICLEKIRVMDVKKLALDEKVIEKYSKRQHVDTHTENCNTGYFYCSRRNKGVLAVSIEVVADNSQEGTALPVYFSFTPHGFTKKEQAILTGREEQKKLEDDRCYSDNVVGSKKVPGITNPPGTDSTAPFNNASPPVQTTKTARLSRSKRVTTVLSLLGTISAFIGKVPLRFDNNYAQKEVIKYYQQDGWQFTGHGKSNLVIARELKEKMNENDLENSMAIINSPDYGGEITVIGYRKHGRIHVYLSNEINCESAETAIKDYRGRWRIENLFKWIPPLHSLSGKDPVIHSGQLVVGFFFLAYLVHYFRAATGTIKALIEQPASVHYQNNVLTFRFPHLPKRYWVKLEHLVQKLSESMLVSICITNDDNQG